MTSRRGTFGTSLLFALLSLVAGPSPALAQGPPPKVSEMSLEDLMRIEVTSASRKEQRATDVAAAVFVITQADIRRSGMTTVPDVLRLAPGVQVAQINANKWAVTVRGFNSLYANKLLILVDGRSLYNRLFSGVIWHAEDLMLDDVERIEIIRGPGAAMWGANAMNGVINIVTKTAGDTPGGSVRVDGGDGGTQAALRYGGRVGAAQYRLFAQWTGRDESLLAPGVNADDESQSVTTGFRTDWTATPGAFSVEGVFTASQEHALFINVDPQTVAGEPVSAESSKGQAGHLLGRWTHTRPGGSSLLIQSVVEVTNRLEPIANYHRDSFAVDSQFHTSLGAHHDVVAGAGYWFTSERLGGRVGVSLTPGLPAVRSSLVTAFLQDDIALFDRKLAITLGSQVQYDSAAGAGVQPTARVMWKVRPNQRLWAAASGALRTPSLTDRLIRFEYPPVPTESGLPLVVTLLGNAAARTERLADLEGGYRLEIGTAASIDVTGFVGRYDRLQTQEPSTPNLQFDPSPRIVVVTEFGNLLAATTRGLEVAATWVPLPMMRLDASYSAFHLTPRLSAASLDPTATHEDGSAPQQQWQLRSAFTPDPRVTLAMAIFRVGTLERLQVPGYTRADATAEWQFTRRLSLMAIGQNLFDAAHSEFAGATTVVQATQARRSASLRLRWTFR